ncbi:phage tail protein, partial [Streptococcus pneumoniae]|nr:phage tail protein [Streptococcus pneumoniae]
MTKINELTIDGVKTSSFKCEILVETRPQIIVSSSKTSLLEHDGISGAIVQSNRHRR